MARKDALAVEGRVLEARPDATFQVELPSGKRVLACLAGKMRLNFIRVLPDDKVVLEISPYDLTRGRIVSCRR